MFRKLKNQAEYRERLKKIKELKEKGQVRTAFVKFIDGEKRIFVMYLNDKNQLKYTSLPISYKEELKQLGVNIDE